MINKLFVYGTLMQGEANYGVIADYVIKNVPAKARGQVFDLPYGYPAMATGEGWAYGELVELRDVERAIKALDHLEGYQGVGKRNLYERIISTVYTATGEIDTAYIYYWSKVGQLQQIGTQVKNGRWSKQHIHLYFAYGSCLDYDGRITTEGMKDEFRILGIGEVKGYRFALNKRSVSGGVCANMVAENGSNVVGLLYQVSDKGLDYLNKREGYPDHYDRKKITVKSYWDNELFSDVFVYIANPKYVVDQPAKVQERYARELKRGAKWLPEPYRTYSFINEIDKHLPERDIAM